MSEADVLYAGLSDPVESGGVGAFVPLDFGRSVNPISTRVGGRLCPPDYYLHPGFSDPPAALRMKRRLPTLLTISVQNVISLVRKGKGLYLELGSTAMYIL